MQSTMIVDSIEEEGDGVWLYAKGEKQKRMPYHINASKEDKVKKGDTIIYEPYGVNFGFMVQKVKK